MERRGPPAAATAVVGWGWAAWEETGRGAAAAGVWKEWVCSSCVRMCACACACACACGCGCACGGVAASMSLLLLSGTKRSCVYV